MIIYDCVGFIHILLYMTSPICEVQYSSLQWQGGSSVCHMLWDWSWNHKPPVSSHIFQLSLAVIWRKSFQISQHLMRQLRWNVYKVSLTMYQVSGYTVFD